MEDKDDFMEEMKARVKMEMLLSICGAMVIENIWKEDYKVYMPSQLVDQARKIM